MNKNKVTILNAPTGIGKTTLFKKLSNSLEHSFTFLAPLKTIVEQQTEYPTILGGTPPEQINIAQSYTLYFSTYASAYKINSVSGRVLVIDESHLLSDRSNILKDELKTIYKLINEAKSVVFISATTNSLLRELYPEANYINIETNQKKVDATPIFYDKNTKELDAVLSYIRANKKGVNVIYWNDKNKLENVQDELIKYGIYKAEEIAKFTASDVDVKSDNYINLVNEQELDENIKIVLATSKIAEGVNIKNKERFNVLFVGSVAKDITFIQQAKGRFRECKQLNISFLFSDAFKTKEGKRTNESNIVKEFRKHLKRQTPVDASAFDFSQSDNSYYSELNWTERALFYFNNEPIINGFELMHQSKLIKLNNLSYSLWLDEIKSIVNIKDAEVISETESQELKEARKERKQNKEEFLTIIRSLLNSKKAGSVLYEIMSNTQNNQLKSLINEELERFEECYLNTDNKILLHKHFDSVQRYVATIFKVMQLTELNYSNSVELFLLDENYKTSKTTLLLKRLTVCKLLEQGATNIEEQKKLNTVKSVLDAFENKTTLSQKEMFDILRSKLLYRMNTENITTVLNKIGFVFNVEYNKHKKEYFIQKIDYQKTLNYINKKQKKVNAEMRTIIDFNTYLDSTNLTRSTA